MKAGVKLIATMCPALLIIRPVAPMTGIQHDLSLADTHLCEFRCCDVWAATSFHDSFLLHGVREQALACEG